MKILACSDFQLGAGPDYGRNPGDRLADQYKALRYINALAAKNECNLILFCGDAFEHRRPSAAELTTFLRWLGGAPCPVLAISGNHDATGSRQPTSLDVFAGQPDFFLNTYAGICHPPGCDVALLPWAHPSEMRAQLNGAVSPSAVADALVKVAAGMRAQCGPTAVLALHWALTGCTLPGNLPTGALREPVLDVEELRAQGWTYIVGGHIHKQQRPAPNAVVCGSPYVCDFGEAELMHGVWILDTHQAVEGVYADPYPIDIAGRPFVTIDLDLTVEDEETFGTTGDVQDAVVRVRYKATEEQARQVDQEKLKRDLYAAGAHKVYSIEAQVERGSRARAEVAHEQMGVLEALEMWLVSQPVDEHDHDALREQTTTYLEAVR